MNAAWRLLLDPRDIPYRWQRTPGLLWTLDFAKRHSHPFGWSRHVPSNSECEPHARNPDSDDTTLNHYFTVDVEEYFNFLGFERRTPRSTWDDLESRVEASVDELLVALSDTGSTGTFFTLGWIAERHPDMVRRIANAGHEIASHGYSHRRVVELTPDEFRDELRRSKAILEELAGRPVCGFRAPHFSLVPGCEWAFDILLEEGYRYDSSLFPIRRRGYGYPQGARDPHVIDRAVGRLVEIPPATLRIGGVNLPAAGGAYFRIFPYELIASALRQCEARSVPGTFYIHPWEIDPGQPMLDVPRMDRLRHYTGLGRTRERLGRLLSDFDFISIAEADALVT